MTTAPAPRTLTLPGLGTATMAFLLPDTEHPAGGVSLDVRHDFCGVTTSLKSALSNVVGGSAPTVDETTVAGQAALFAQLDDTWITAVAQAQHQALKAAIAGLPAQEQATLQLAGILDALQQGRAISVD